MSSPSSRQRSLGGLLLATALGGCTGAGTPPADPPVSLLGSEWRLQDIGGQAVPAQPAATLAFPQAGQVAGHGACNRFFGPVTIERERLSIGPLASTRMACMGTMEQESRYLGALQQAQRYEVQGEVLLIHTQGMDRPLRFVRTAPRP